MTLTALLTILALTIPPWTRDCSEDRQQESPQILSAPPSRLAVLVSDRTERGERRQAPSVGPSLYSFDVSAPVTARFVSVAPQNIGAPLCAKSPSRGPPLARLA